MQVGGMGRKEHMMKMSCSSKQQHMGRQPRMAWSCAAACPYLSVRRQENHFAGFLSFFFSGTRLSDRDSKHREERFDERSSRREFCCLT